MKFYFYQLNYKHEHNEIISNEHQTIIENYIIGRFDKHPLILIENNKTLVITNNPINFNSKEIVLTYIGVYDSLVLKT